MNNKKLQYVLLAITNLSTIMFCLTFLIGIEAIECRAAFYMATMPFAFMAVASALAFGLVPQRAAAPRVKRAARACRGYIGQGGYVRVYTEVAKRAA